MSEETQTDSHAAEMNCTACGDLLSERRAYDGSTGKLVRTTLYCYSCENAALWRLARTAGK